MCGIVGYVGNKLALPIILSGLKKLEYRGYDSAGVCLCECGKLVVKKQKGEVDGLAESLKNSIFCSSVAIGHTRWATHGSPEKRNAHPHTNLENSIAVVHNGIIENFEDLKQSLDVKFFRSSTDTEVFVQMLSQELSNKSLTKQNVLDAIILVTNKIKGSFAFAILISAFQDCIFVAKRFSPLLIGFSENQNFVASDICAILPYTNKVAYLGDNQVGIVEKNLVKLFDCNLKPIKISIVCEKMQQEKTLLNGYSCYMEKEIEEGKIAIENTILSLTKQKTLNKISKNIIKKIDEIHICACGTAMHAGLYAKALFEKYLGINVFVEIASEFRYKKPIFSKKALCIFISQSGETADTIAGLQLAKSVGAYCISITNVEKSRITQLSDFTIYTKAGPEIAVASTKAYVAQVSALMYLLNFILKQKGKKTSILENLNKVALLWNKQKPSKMLYDVVEKVKNLQSLFFVGRGIDFYLAMEGALKLKEISYIHCEAFAGGELKHGSLALINDKSFVIAILTQKNLIEKTMNAVYEIKSRGGKVVLFSQFGFLKEKVDYFVKIKSGLNSDCTPLLCAKALQQLALLTSLTKNINPDKPRNLAKSVTVE